MKLSKSITLLSIVKLICLVKNASAIMCYDCNSAFDPRCGEHFDSFSLGVVNCSLREPLDHLPDAEPTICRTIKMEIYGNVRFVRSCGYIVDENATQPCRRQTGNGDVFTTYCSCDTDLCNSASDSLGILSYVTVPAILLTAFRF